MGGTQRTFSVRELDHMVDVKNLFIAGLNLRRGCLLLAVVSAGLLYFLKGKLSSILPLAMCVGTGLFFLAACLLAAIVSTDFTKYFTVFHEIFFDNDLWLLNPNEDLLINIVRNRSLSIRRPALPLFFGGSVLLLLAACLLSLYCSKRNKRCHQNNTIGTVM